MWWRTKNPDAMLQGYKIDLQHMLGSKMPAALLKLVYRFTYRRKVKAFASKLHLFRFFIFTGNVPVCGENFISGGLDFLFFFQLSN